MNVPSTAGSSSTNPIDPSKVNKPVTDNSEGELKGRKITADSESERLQIPPTPRPTKDKKFDFNVNTSYVSKSKPSVPLKIGGIHYSYEELKDVCQSALLDLACAKYNSLEIDAKYELLEKKLKEELNLNTPIENLNKNELNELLEKTNIYAKIIDYSYDFDIRNLMDDPLTEVPESFGPDPREYLKNTIRSCHLQILGLIQRRQIDILSQLMSL